jgi:proline iminopeptidase
MFPPVEPYASGHLSVGDGHVLYWEAVGREAGSPAVYLHGGPGSGSAPWARQYFDPSTYRAVLFDQRGCGRSRPLADDARSDLSTNTTADLVRDIERLREHLGIDRWVVVGLSWGVTLGLVYAQTHPQRVSAMVLGAVTSGERREIDWITRDMGRVFPVEWDTFVAMVPEHERDGDLASAYARLLADPTTQEKAAMAWCQWEDTHVSLAPGWAPSSRYADPVFRSVFSRLVTHFWSHGCFLADRQVLAGMPRIQHIPGVLIHGRWDISGPLVTAQRLHQAWPGSRLVMLEQEGHGGTSMNAAVVAALQSLSGGPSSPSSASQGRTAAGSLEGT